MASRIRRWETRITGAFGLRALAGFVLAAGLVGSGCTGSAEADLEGAEFGAANEPAAIGKPAAVDGPAAGNELAAPEDVTSSPAASDFTTGDSLVRRGARRELVLAVEQGEGAEHSYRLITAIAETEEPFAIRRLVVSALEADVGMAREAASVLLARSDVPHEVRRVVEASLAEHERQASLGPKQRTRGEADADEETGARPAFAFGGEGLLEQARWAPLLRTQARQTTDLRHCAQLLRQMEGLPAAVATDLLAAELEATAGCGVEHRNQVLAGLGRLQRRAGSAEDAGLVLSALLEHPRRADDAALIQAALGDVEATEALSSEAALSALISLSLNLEPNQELRLRAVAALGRSASPRAQAHLERMLQRLTHSEAILSAVLDALESRTGGIRPEVANGLAPFTSVRERPEFRRRVVAILAKDGAGAATARKLEELSRSSDPEVADLASQGLERLTAAQ